MSILPNSPNFVTQIRIRPKTWSDVWNQRPRNPISTVCSLCETKSILPAILRPSLESDQKSVAILFRISNSQNHCYDTGFSNFWSKINDFFFKFCEPEKTCFDTLEIGSRPSVPKSFPPPISRKSLLRSYIPSSSAKIVHIWTNTSRDYTFYISHINILRDSNFSSYFFLLKIIPHLAVYVFMLIHNVSTISPCKSFTSYSQIFTFNVNLLVSIGNRNVSNISLQIEWTYV